MRYEAMRLMQFLFSLSLIVLAFAAGVVAGWYRWAPRSVARPVDPDSSDRSTSDDALWAANHAGGGGTDGRGARVTGSPRSTLFAPVGDAWPSQRAPKSGGPLELLAVDEVVDLRLRNPSARAEIDRRSVGPADPGPSSWGPDAAPIDL